LFNVFETTLRQKLANLGKTNDDIINWIKKDNFKGNIKEKRVDKYERYERNIKQIKLPDFQHIELRDLLKFLGDVYPSFKMNKEKIQTIINIRNNIMHNKDISSRQSTTIDINKEMLYERKDYEKFIKGYDIIIEQLIKLQK